MVVWNIVATIIAYNNLQSFSVGMTNHNYNILLNNLTTSTMIWAFISMILMGVGGAIGKSGLKGQQKQQQKQQQQK
jgi:hypothetical protein